MLRLLASLLLTPLVPIVWFIVVWCIGFYDTEIFWIVSGISFLLYITALFATWHSWRGEYKIQRGLLWMHTKKDKDWINKLIELLWPHVGNVVKKILTNDVQDIIRKSSNMLSKFEFTDIDIGDRAPQISSITIYGQATTLIKEIIVDLNFKLESNCNIEVKMNRLKAGICDFGLQGVLRVVLGPLLEDPPLIGAVTIAFIDEPLIHYDLTSLANLFDFPGFDKILQYAVGQVVKSMMVLPERICIRIDNKLSISQIRFPVPQGVLRITIVGGHNLQVPNRSFMSRKFLGMRAPVRPYVVVKVGNEKQTTKAISTSDHPMWNESFKFFIFDIPCTKVEISVHDDDSLVLKDSWIASVTLPVETVEERGVIDKVISICKITKSKLHVCLEWYELSSNPADLRKASRLSRTSTFKDQALLNVYAAEANNLPQPSDLLTLNPVLRIQISETEQYKTSVAFRTTSPKWNDNFRIYLTYPEGTAILFEVYDSSKKDILGTLTFPVKKLINAEGMTMEDEFPLKNSTTGSTLHLRMSLRILKLKPKFHPKHEVASEFTINKLPFPRKQRESVLFTVRKASAGEKKKKE